MVKAYQGIQWEFFDKLLCKMSYSNILIKWIMACVTSLSLLCYFELPVWQPLQSCSGLSDGGPVTPLFIITKSNVLSFLITHKVKDRTVNVIK